MIGNTLQFVGATVQSAQALAGGLIMGARDGVCSATCATVDAVSHAVHSTVMVPVSAAQCTAAVAGGLYMAARDGFCTDTFATRKAMRSTINTSIKKAKLSGYVAGRKFLREHPELVMAWVSAVTAACIACTVLYVACSC